MRLRWGWVMVVGLAMAAFAPLLRGRSETKTENAKGDRLLSGSGISDVRAVRGMP